MSKALLTAIHELRLVMQFRGSGATDDQLADCVRRIVRAFGNNLSRDAGAAGAQSYWQTNEPDDSYEAEFITGVRAALEEDLK